MVKKFSSEVICFIVSIAMLVGLLTPAGVLADTLSDNTVVKEGVNDSTDVNYPSESIGEQPEAYNNYEMFPETDPSYAHYDEDEFYQKLEYYWKNDRLQDDISANALPNDDVEANAAIPTGYNPCTVDAFTKTTSLKGIQGVGNYGDHYFINLMLEPFFDNNGKFDQNYFNAWANGFEYTVKACNEKGQTVNVEFLISPSRYNFAILDQDGLSDVLAGIRKSGNTLYYGPNLSNSTQKAQYKALFDNMAERFSKADCHVDNWILGNEVNMQGSQTSYYYTGHDKSKWVSKYAAYYLLVYNSVRTYTNATRVSACLDHSWQHNDEGRGIATKDFLNQFNNLVKKSDWTLSYHCYPAVLFETEIWLGFNRYAGTKLNRNDPSAMFVDGANLNVMTDYIKTKFGSKHRIMMTEQGFTNYRGAGNQAACFALTYYACKFDDMVDCMIVLKDNNGDPRLNFTITPGSLYKNTMDKIDTGADGTKWINQNVLPYTGVGSWSVLVPGYDEKKLLVNRVKVEQYVKNLYKVGYNKEISESELKIMTDSICAQRMTLAKAAENVLLSSDAKKYYNYSIDENGYVSSSFKQEEFIKGAYKAMTGKTIPDKLVTTYKGYFAKDASLSYILSKILATTDFKNYTSGMGVTKGSITLEARDKNFYATKYVQDVTQRFLARKATVAELNNYTKKLVAKTTTMYAVAVEISADSSLGDTEYINEMYKLFKGRKAQKSEVSKAKYLIRHKGIDAGKKSIVKGLAGTKSFKKKASDNKLKAM